MNWECICFSKKAHQTVTSPFNWARILGLIVNAPFMSMAKKTMSSMSPWLAIKSYTVSTLPLRQSWKNTSIIWTSLVREQVRFKTLHGARTIIYGLPWQPVRRSLESSSGSTTQSFDCLLWSSTWTTLVKEDAEVNRPRFCITYFFQDTQCSTTSYFLLNCQTSIHNLCDPRRTRNNKLNQNLGSISHVYFIFSLIKNKNHFKNFFKENFVHTIIFISFTNPV